MKSASLVLLRVSLGILMLLWGLDKLVDVDHSVAVAQGFYLDAFAVAGLQRVLGVLQIVLSLLVVVGVARRYAYPVLLVVAGITLLGVWKSIVDPWGWYLQGTNVLFFPSLIIFAGALVLMAFRDDDSIALDARLANRA